jgi:hypothetical protein
MMKFIRKYQRWALAFFGVLLMLTFLGNRGSGGGNDNSDRVLGHLNGKAVTKADVDDARAELSTIEHYTSITDPQSFRQVSLLARLFGPRQANDFLETPVLFYLLREEARLHGVPIPAAELDQIMTQLYQGPPVGSDEYTATRAALSDLFLVSGRFQQLQNDIKLSRPALDHVLASQRESIGVNFVQFQASDYAAKVPAPTTQQVQEQFTKFADTLPGTIEPGTDPFGFGYKLPVRARVQYLSVTPKTIDDAIIAAGPADVVRPAGWSVNQWWDLAGMKYYLAHRQDFAPADDSTTRPAGPQPIPPYAKVRDQILELIRKPAAEKLVVDIKSYCNGVLNKGWQTYQQYAAASPTPATQPSTGLGEQYSSVEFLRHLADQVHTRFNVIGTVDDTGQPAALPLNKTLAVPALADDQSSDFVSSQAAAFLAAADRKSLATAAQLMHPSPPIQVQSDSPILFIRLVSVLPSVPPEDVSSVQAAVTRDLLKSASYALAKADADRLLAGADEGKLADTAAKMGQHVISTLPNSPLSLNPDSEQSISPTSIVYPPLGNMEQEFTVKTFTLLGPYNPKSNPAPAKLVELEPQGRVFVVQLKNVIADWNTEDYYKTILQTHMDLTRELLPRLAGKWFDYDAVAKRTGYKPVKTSNG